MTIVAYLELSQNRKQGNLNWTACGESDNTYKRYDGVERGALDEHGDDGRSDRRGTRPDGID